MSAAPDPAPDAGPLKETPFAFGVEFLDDHAGHIISEPAVAIIELIANSYDAGATRVSLTWPEKTGDLLVISDNGTGMTTEEFHLRWKTLKYNRLVGQGDKVEFPPGVRGRSRTAFGRNGKGRHGAFCFGDQYSIETIKSGVLTRARMSRSRVGSEPFHCEVIAVEEAPGHGTTITATVERQLVDADALIALVGSKFAVDPEFKITVNGASVALLDLTGVTTTPLAVDGVGTLLVHEVHAAQSERNTRFRGVTWWVKKRIVGESSWEGLDERGAILDGRTAAAKKYSFVVEADILADLVKADWTSFHQARESIEACNAVRSHVTTRLHELLADSRKERKKKVIEEHRKAIGELPIISKRVVGQFIDEVQQSCPTLSEMDLSRTVAVLTKLEHSRSGYDLLANLAKCSPNDLDTWNRLMAEWTATHAEIVLNELGRRLKLISDLTTLVHAKTTDELHDLQPLFARGLWMFGPEFESAEFTSNRGMATVIRTFFGSSARPPSARRPDIVVLPDASIAAYSADAYDSGNEITGVRSVAVIELKKGGFPLTLKEVRQAEDYVKEIRLAKLIQPSTKITAYVLGATIDDAEQRTLGDDHRRVVPITYDLVLQKAHSRTFQLKKKLEMAEPPKADKEVEETLARPQQVDMDYEIAGGLCL